jgi:serine/threonine-protein kinase
MIGRTRARTDLVKLLDFGIARVMGRETQHFTSTGLIVGTPEWMSPEQIAGDKLDARSDIYTLGLIAFRMLTGEAPSPAPPPRKSCCRR